MAHVRILLVEDEELIGRMIELNLRSLGFEVTWIQDGEEALAAARTDAHDALVLDVMLPSRDGFDIVRTLRAEGHTLPVLMLTARGDVASRVTGLDAGADDYLAKPFDMPELMARVRALIRRAEGDRHVPSAHVARFDRYEINFETREAVTNGGRIHLTEKEAGLMQLFWKRRGENISRADMLEGVWGMDAFPTERTVDNVIVRLRRYFEPDAENPTHILSVRGHGYRFHG